MTSRIDVNAATTQYERWMRRCTPIIDSQLRDKHEQMRADLFGFCRATFYRWIQLWPAVCADCQSAPRVLAVGDLHVDSFGTWRDGEGRLCWGVDDFDEACPLPYTNDLIRLASSARIVIDNEQLRIKYRHACDAILEGYWHALKDGGDPIVLAEREVMLERLGVDELEPPQEFWPKLQKRPAPRHPVPRDARRVLERALPNGCPYKIVTREAGIGSLGQLRFVAIAEWHGGWIAREAKAMVPSASVWVRGRVGNGQRWYERALQNAARSRDPFQVIDGTWLIRRLSPDSNPIEMATLQNIRDEEALLFAMGSEAANVHVGTRREVTKILTDLRRRKAKWLRVAAKAMTDALHDDWKEYRKHRGMA